MYKIIFIFIYFNYSTASHLKGDFRTNEFFKFLIKFGFQQTEEHAIRETCGYIFGNITSNHKFKEPITFAVLDRSNFLKYYGNRTVQNKTEACQLMFNDLSKKSYDSVCNPTGSKDYLRRVPCSFNQLCQDEDNADNVIKNHQFTYLVEDTKQPHFWYISIVACYRNRSTCKWSYYGDLDNSANAIVNYDFWVVNGNQSTSNIFAYQFSFDRMNTLELYFLFWLCYVFVVPLQCVASRIQKHPVTKLFTCSLILEFFALNLIVLHMLQFAVNGIGFPHLAILGDIFDILSRTTFMLLLLLLAKGWAITRIELSHRKLVLLIWLCYGVVHILLYIWNMTEVDIIEDIDEYQTWPGFIIIIFRTIIVVWFLMELRTTMMYEHNIQKLNFFLHFGASSLVWFMYLPIIAIVALQISPLWRYKLLVGITYSADCLAYCIMAHLLWPTRSEQYFLLAARSTSEIEELDQFNEAPHVINNKTISLSSIECDE